MSFSDNLNLFTYSKGAALVSDLYAKVLVSRGNLIQNQNPELVHYPGIPLTTQSTVPETHYMEMF